MKHRFLFAIFAVALAMFSGTALSAQTRDLDFSNLAEFNGIEVSDSFEVTVTPSNFYGAKVVVDDVLSGCSKAATPPRPFCVPWSRFRPWKP